MDRLNFLVADDSDHMRALIRTVLHTIGCHQVLGAENGRVALELVRHEPVDIAIVDWNMEPMDGLDFTRAVRAGDGPNPYLPIIMVTAYSQAKQVLEARDAGVSEYLTKPLSARALVGRILAVVDRPRPFVRTGHFFGPDRRRHTVPEIARERRHDSPQSPRIPEAPIGFDLMRGAPGFR